MRRQPVTFRLALLLTSCVHPLRGTYLDATVSAYTVTPIRGQDAAQTQADIAACRQELEVLAPMEPAVPAFMAIEAEAQRSGIYRGCMKARGYTTDLRPMAER
jgi:hypothetical protein